MKSRRKKRLDPNTVVLMKRIFSGILAIGVVSMLIAGIWHGSRINSLTISEVSVSGGETIDYKVVEMIVRLSLEGQYVGLIPRSFAWLYPQSDIEDSLQQIDRIHNINVSRLSSKKIHITFEEYIPKALWCAELQSQDCLFVDKSGYAYAKAPNLAGGSFLRFIKVGQGHVLGQVVIPAEDFDQLLLIVELFKNEEWFVSHLEVDKAGDAFLALVGGGEFKVTLAQSPEETVDNLRVVLASEDFQHIKPGNFQYIDLRFGNKVFINEEELSPEVSTSTATSTP